MGKARMRLKTTRKMLATSQAAEDLLEVAEMGRA